MSEYRTVEVTHLAVCENGHVAGWEPAGEKALQLKHTCGKWTWADGDFCQGCGQSLQVLPKEERADE